MSNIKVFAKQDGQVVEQWPAGLPDSQTNMTDYKDPFASHTRRTLHDSGAC